MFEIDIRVPEMGEDRRAAIPDRPSPPVSPRAFARAAGWEFEFGIPELGERPRPTAARLATAPAPREPTATDGAAFDWGLPELGERRRWPASIGPPAARETGLRVAATDGWPLAATLFEPLRPNGVVVQVNGAYAVKRGYYLPFARWLCAQGFTVLTYDYRGTGGSRRESWRGEAPRMHHWGDRDLAGVAEWLAARFPGRTLVALGHSAGGQLLGLAPNNHRFAAALSIASQAGHWRLWDFPWNLVTLLWFQVIVPATAWLGTLFPTLRRGGFDVPRTVALEWARWGRSPHYVSTPSGAPIRTHFFRYRGRMRFIQLTDDVEWAPWRAVAALAGYYRNARVEIVQRAPRDWGAERVGHFGFFRKSMPVAAWRETAHWMHTQASAYEADHRQEAVA